MGRRVTGFVLLFGMLVIIIIANANVTTLQTANGFSVNDDLRVTYILLLNPKCDYIFSTTFDFYMHLNNTEYEKYVGNYKVVCMGGVKNLDDIDNFIVPALRVNFPTEKFVFVYSDSMKDQYANYIQKKFGSEYKYSVWGNADIKKGIAYAGESPAVVKHETSHLYLCGTWHDSEGKDLGYIVKYPNASIFPWCSKLKS